MLGKLLCYEASMILSSFILERAGFYPLSLKTFVFVLKDPSAVGSEEATIINRVCSLQEQQRGRMLERGEPLQQRFFI